MKEWILYCGNLGVVLAQASTDPISGGAGWVGAGLLGIVLGWLLFRHLPAKDQQLKEFSEAKDRHVNEVLASSERLIELVTSAFRLENQETRKEFRESLQFIMAQSREQTLSLATAINKEFQILNERMEERK